MSLFLGTPKWESQNWDYYCPKTLDVHIFFKSIFFFENVKAIIYNPQNDLSNNVLHALIRAHLTHAFKGFMVKSQISNLTPTLFFIIITHENQV